MTPRRFVTQHDVEQARQARRARIIALAARLGVEYRRALALATTVSQEHHMTLDETVEALGSALRP
jgi:hypothetical protein